MVFSRKTESDSLFQSKSHWFIVNYATSASYHVTMWPWSAVCITQTVPSQNRKLLSTNWSRTSEKTDQHLKGRLHIKFDFWIRIYLLKSKWGGKSNHSGQIKVYPSLSRVIWMMHAWLFLSVWLSVCLYHRIASEAGLFFEVMLRPRCPAYPFDVICITCSPECVSTWTSVCACMLWICPAWQHSSATYPTCYYKVNTITSADT